MIRSTARPGAERASGQPLFQKVSGRLTLQSRSRSLPVFGSFVAWGRHLALVRAVLPEQRDRRGLAGGSIDENEPGNSEPPSRGSQCRSSLKMRRRRADTNARIQENQKIVGITRLMLYGSGHHRNQRRAAYARDDETR